MNKWVKGISITIAVIVTLPILLWLSGYLLPDKVVLETERTINASPEAILDLLNSHEGLVNWWHQANQDMGESIEVRHLEGPTNGPGMMTGFAGADGIVLEKWTHLEPRQPGQMQIEVDFQIFVSNRTLTLTPDEAGTLITWHEVAIVEEPHWRWLLKLSATSAIKNRQTVMGAIEKVLLQQ